MTKETIISAKDLGIKFRVSRFKKSTMKELVIKTSLKKGGLKRNEPFWGLRNINFEVQRGDILGVLGQNGSGKSTLLRTIAGIYQPDEGSIEVNGSVSSLLSLNTGLIDDLNGIENIYLTGVLTGFTEKQITEKLNEIVEFSELGDYIHQPVKTYSSGMQSRLSFSIAVTLRRDIMLVDEILGVGDFKFKDKSRDKMLEIINGDATIILVSHDEDTIRSFATKCIWINNGEMMASGTTEEVMAQYYKS